MESETKEVPIEELVELREGKKHRRTFKRGIDGKPIQSDGDRRAERMAEIKRRREGPGEVGERGRNSGVTYKLKPGRPLVFDNEEVMRIEAKEELVTKGFLTSIQLRHYREGRYDNRLAGCRKSYVRTFKPLEIIAKERSFSLALLRYKMIEDRESGREWLRMKQALMDGAVKLEMMSRSQELSDIVGMDLALIREGLRDLMKLREKGELALSIRDIEKLTLILTNLHRVECLELGRPTESISVDLSRMSAREIENSVVNVLLDIKNNDFAIDYEPLIQKAEQAKLIEKSE